MKEEVKKNKREKEEVKMKKELKELVREKEEGKMMKEEGKMMKEELKELAKEIDTKKLLLIEKVFKWSQGLNPVKDLHVKVKGSIYPLIGKGGKLYIINKVQGKKIPFNTLDKAMQFVICSTLAERKEEIEKEVEEDKKKYLERKAAEIDKLLSKF